MAAKTHTSNLAITAREVTNSRATRRLRREGVVPGVLYGLDRGNLAFAVDARELRNALSAQGAVLELSLDGQKTSAVVKDQQKHPVRGEITHIDLLRVDVNQPIEAEVAINVVGAEESPGVIAGGILSQPARSILVEALPNDIPEAIDVDASALETGGMVTLDQIAAPAGVTIVRDETAEETVVVTITAPTLEPVEDELETETEVVGEGEDGAAAEGDDAEGGSDEPAADGDDA